jgi:hypothetical protein
MDQDHAQAERTLKEQFGLSDQHINDLKQHGWQPGMFLGWLQKNLPLIITLVTSFAGNTGTPTVGGQ